MKKHHRLLGEALARPTQPVPAVILTALEQGAALGISISGGKDSQALLAKLVPWHRAQGYTGALFAVHADLGRAEWAETPAFVEELARRYDIPLVITRRPKGDLVRRIEERLESLAGSGKPFWPDSEQRYCTGHNKANPIDTTLRNLDQLTPFWPSADQRYCTSDAKRGPIDAALRAQEYCNDVVISVEGVRADESPKRRKKPEVEVRKSITATSTVKVERNLSVMSPAAALAARQQGQRLGLNWRPLLHYTTEEVWAACGTSVEELSARQALYKAGQQAQALAGWIGHPAYVIGNQRLSCALCVFGSENDLLNGAHAQPELYAHFIALEIVGQSTFKNGWSLQELPVTGRAAELRAEVLAGRLVPYTLPPDIAQGVAAARAAQAEQLATDEMIADAMGFGAEPAPLRPGDNLNLF